MTNKQLLFIINQIEKILTTVCLNDMKGFILKEFHDQIVFVCYFNCLDELDSPVFNLKLTNKLNSYARESKKGIIKKLRSVVDEHDFDLMDLEKWVMRNI